MKFNSNDLIINNYQDLQKTYFFYFFFFFKYVVFFLATKMSFISIKLLKLFCFADLIFYMPIFNKFSKLYILGCCLTLLLPNSRTAIKEQLIALFQLLIKGCFLCLVLFEYHTCSNLS